MTYNVSSQTLNATLSIYFITSMSARPRKNISAIFDVKCSLLSDSLHPWYAIHSQPYYRVHIQ